jgi:hypothetical protein
MGIVDLTSPSYASAYNGWFERSHESILSQLRLLRADHPSLEWTVLIPSALHIINSRPYLLSQEILPTDSHDCLTPLHLVFANSKFNSGFFTQTSESGEDNSLMLRECGIEHLLRTLPSIMALIADDLKLRREAALESYLKIFENKRKAIRKRLEQNLPAPVLSTDYLPVGSWVRVYRPGTSKVDSNYSLPREVVGAPSAATRLVQSSLGGPATLEYIGNLLLHANKSTESLENTEGRIIPSPPSVP